MKKKNIIPVLIVLLCVMIILAFRGGASKSSAGTVTFKTTDIDGNPVSLADFSSAKVIMLNLWEPWCGPCVSEMGELQNLYDNYKDKGFVLLGAFSDEDSASARKVMDQKKITYPIIHYDDNILALATQYVPTTVFIDGKGNLLSEEPYIGAKSYADWEKLLLSFLK